MLRITSGQEVHCISFRVKVQSFLKVNFVCVCVFQASVSLKRLKVFLSHEELQEDSVQRTALVGSECRYSDDDYYTTPKKYLFHIGDIFLISATIRLQYLYTNRVKSRYFLLKLFCLWILCWHIKSVFVLHCTFFDHQCVFYFLTADFPLFSSISI